MFWAKEEEENSLMQLLKSENFTLEDVLLNEFVVQDSRYGKPELVAYITKRENMVALLNLSLNPTIDPNVPMKQQYRLSFIASEILTIRGTDVFQELIVTTEETRKVLIDFMSDKKPLTHLIAGFFAKIMECLLSRKFLLTFDLLQDTPFFDKCIQNINLGAIECLLENLIRIPNNSDGTRAVKQWMIHDNLFEKLVDRISDQVSDDDNECLSEVYCEILRELRDKLYMVENKEDELHDKAMDEALIARIADNLIVNEDCSSEELVKKSGMISASAKILEAFIKTNYVPDSPAQRLEEVERNQLEERHYSYGLMRPCLDAENFEQSYQPDPTRLVEGIVANRIPNILETILKSITANGSVWQPLLRMVIELCNTNNMSTHEKLADALQKLPFVKLLDAAKTHPRASVMHSLLVKFISLILNTTFPEGREVMSPAAEYLLVDSGLIKNIYDTACSFHTSTDLIACCGLRAFNQNLGDSLLKASRGGLFPKRVSILIKNDKRWAELEEIILNYNGKNRPQLLRDYQSDSVLSSIRNDSREGFNDSEEWTDAAAKFAELDASSTSHIRNFGSFDAKLFDASFSRFSDLDGQFDVTPDEDEFKKLCSERANSSSCSNTRPSDSFAWPGEEEKEDEKPKPETSIAPSTCHALATENPSFVISEEEWVWPASPPLGDTELVTKSGPRPDNVWVDETVSDLSYLESSPPKADEMWADFSSFSSANPPAPTTPPANEFLWPGAKSPEQGENSDWPLNSSHDSNPSDPNTVGLAASISPPKDDNSSEA